MNLLCVFECVYGYTWLPRWYSGKEYGFQCRRCMRQVLFLGWEDFLK